MIKIYNKNENNFDHNGLGILRDALSCVVTEEDNGQFELYLEYINSGFLSEYLVNSNIIKAKANHHQREQLFRIYKVENDIDENIKVFAKHISYDLIDNFVENVNALNKNCNDAGNLLLSSATIPHNFKFHSDITHTANFSMARSNILECIAGKKGSLVDTYGNGTKIIRDNFNISLMKNRGANNNVLISYKKNLIGYTRTIDESEVITAIYPFAKFKRENNDIEELLALPERFIYSKNYSNYKKILAIDFSGDEIDTIDKLRSVAEKYFLETKKDIPKINYKVEFLELSKTLEYKDLGIENLEKISLGDTVKIRDFRINMDIEAKVIKTVFDAIRETYNEIELGNFKDSLSKTINDINSNIENKFETVKNDILVNFEILDDRITTQVSNLEKELTTKIEITADGILEEIIDVENGLKLEINKTATSINQTITDTKNNLQSQISQNAKSIKLLAEEIEIAGYVTFTDLKSNNGKTIINGGNITTGTIDASRVNVTNLNASNIKAGTIDGNAITVKNLNADNITTGSINGQKIDINNINANNITQGSIDANKIKVKNIDADNITSGTIDARYINVKNLNANNITSGSISADRISGGTIVGSLLKTSERSSNYGVEIANDKVYIGSSIVGFYNGGKFSLYSPGNIYIESGGNVYINPSSILSINSNLTAMGYDIGSGSSYWKYTNWYADTAGGSIYSYGLKLNFTNLVGTSSGNLHVTNGSGSKGGIYGTLMGSKTLSKTININEDIDIYSILDNIEIKNIDNNLVPMNKTITYTDFNESDLNFFVRTNKQKSEINIENCVYLLLSIVKKQQEKIKILEDIYANR